MIVRDSGPHIARITRLEDELDIARERIRELEAALGANDDLIPLRMLGLSQSEARIVNLLSRRDYATEDQLRLSVYIDDPERRFNVQRKTLFVMMHMAKEKLRCLGVSFSSLGRYGAKSPGYRMLGPDKARLARLLASKAALLSGTTADMRQPAQRLRAQMGAA